MLEVIYSKADGIKKALVKGKGWTPVVEINELDEVKCSKQKFVFEGDLAKKYVWRTWSAIPWIIDSKY